MAGSDQKHTSTTECIVYGLISILFWVLCLTILLPFVLLMKFSKAIQNKFFSWIFLYFEGGYFSETIVPLRKTTFDILKDKLDGREDKKSESLKVLEIGIGSGANFKYYPEGSSLIAVDMNDNFEDSLQKKLEEHPEIKLERIVNTMAEDMSDVDDDSVDVVVSTEVLCSTVDVTKVLRETRRVLKPGGVFLFLEHVVFPDNQCGRIVQKFISPLWSVVFAGCRVDRDTVNEIKNNGFSELDLRLTEIPKLPLYVRTIAYGIATK